MTVTFDPVLDREHIIVAREALAPYVGRGIAPHTLDDAAEAVADVLARLYRNRYAEQLDEYEGAAADAHELMVDAHDRADRLNEALSLASRRFDAVRGVIASLERRDLAEYVRGDIIVGQLRDALDAP